MSLGLTGRIFAQYWRDLRRHSESLLAIIGPVVLAKMLMDLSMTTLERQSPFLRLSLVVSLGLLLLRLLVWLLEFVAFGALAAFARTRVLRPSFDQVRSVFGRLILLALLVLPAVFVGFLVPNVGNTIPAAPAFTRTFWFVDLAFWIVLTLLTAFALAVPALLDQTSGRKRGPMDALAEGVRTAAGYFPALAIIVLGFYLLPTFAINLARVGIVQALQHSSKLVPVVRSYNVFAYFFEQFALFSGLYALCLLYNEVAKSSRENLVSAQER
jgi:hypothetical protein